MKLFFYSLCFLLLHTLAFSQQDAWVYFKDKPNALKYTSNPLLMLSQRSIDRRVKQGIIIDEKDVPVDLGYYNKIKSTAGITVLAKSKWLNSIHVQGTQQAIQSLKLTFNFVKKIQFCDRSLNQVKRTAKEKSNVKFKEENRIINISKRPGNAKFDHTADQLNFIKAPFFHEKGFTGKGIQIAVIDAGFYGVDTMEGFKRLLDNKKILGGYNYVNRKDDFYTDGTHGRHVLSVMGGYLDNQYMKYTGVAPDASFYLFVTENWKEEVPLEESLWVEAAEKADSLGVDIISSSLGYNDKFDNKAYNYTYKDMDGKTSFISQGAEIASTKGMLVVVSAGNDGNNTWKYIGAPADAEGVLTVGAVKLDGTITSFSSKGLTADGRIKPDVAAQGQNVAIITRGDSEYINYANGTSYSTPIISGLAACLWQSLPNKTAVEIREIIKKSANKYENPNVDYGYGIPDFQVAYKTLDIDKISEKESYTLYPNPTNNVIKVKGLNTKPNYFIIYDRLGRKVFEQNKNSSILNISSLKQGIYFLKINNLKAIKLIKN